MLPQNDSLVYQYAGLSSAPDPGSGAFLTPGSGIGFFRNLDLGSRILNHTLLTKFWVKSSILLNTKRTFKNSCKGVNREEGEFILATAVFRRPEPFRQFLFTAKCSDIVKNKHSSNFFYLDFLTLSGAGISWISLSKPSDSETHTPVLGIGNMYPDPDPNSFYFFAHPDRAATLQLGLIPN
jgi:hypothetical protein